MMKSAVFIPIVVLLCNKKWSKQVDSPVLVEDQFLEMETDDKTREVRSLAKGLRW